MGILTTVSVRVAEMTVAPDGTWLATSNFITARLRSGSPAEPAVVPDTKLVFAPRLLSGLVSNKVVSATG